MRLRAVTCNARGDKGAPPCSQQSQQTRPTFASRTREGHKFRVLAPTQQPRNTLPERGQKGRGGATNAPARPSNPLKGAKSHVLTAPFCVWRQRDFFRQSSQNFWTV